MKTQSSSSQTVFPSSSLIGSRHESLDLLITHRRLTSLIQLRYLIRLVVWEVLLFVLLFYFLALIRQLELVKANHFSLAVVYFDANLSTYARDLTFLLGFYVAMVARRWWEQYRLLPWPDDIAMTLTGVVVSSDLASARLRQAIVRYALLAYVLCIRRFSSNLKRTLPEVRSIVDLGLVRYDELEALNLSDFADDNHWWLPLAWITNLVKFAKANGQVSDTKEMNREVLDYRWRLESVDSHAQVGIPFVYKVVVNFATVGYFVLALIGRQGREVHEGGVADWLLEFPLFSVVQIIFFVSWVKVARAIEKPFGEDDVDFELIALVKRHISACEVILQQFDKVPVVKESWFRDSYLDLRRPSTSKSVQNLPKLTSSLAYVNFDTADEEKERKEPMTLNKEAKKRNDISTSVSIDSSDLFGSQADAAD